MQAMSRLIVLLGVVGVSLSAVLVRLSTAPSMVLVLYRVVWAVLLLTPYVLLRCQEELKRLQRRELLLCLGSGVFLGLHFSSYFEALRLTSIAVTTVLVNTEVIFVSLGTILFLKGRLSGRAWTAVGIAFAGSVIVAMADLSGGGSLLGNLLALAGAMLCAAYTLVGTVCRRGGISTTVYTYFVYLSAAGTVLVLSLATGLRLTGYGPVNLLTALGMAVFCTLLGHSVFSWGLKYLPASFVSTAKLLEPVFASVWGLLLFRERPAPLVIAGGAVVILGVSLYGRAAGREEQPLPEPEAAIQRKTKEEDA